METPTPESSTSYDDKAAAVADEITNLYPEDDYLKRCLVKLAVFSYMGGILTGMEILRDKTLDRIDHATGQGRR